MSLVITSDIDWAPEIAIEEMLGFFIDRNIRSTIFVTHLSKIIENNMKKLDVGLHPYFAPDSSHGSSISDVVDYVINLPHNFMAYRCHRFAGCNLSHQAMVDAGMKISSNICTDLEIVRPFRNRYGIIEVPIYMEDGGFLWQKHKKLQEIPGTKVILIHPMHFVINTPNFEYMSDIKKNITRDEWRNMTLAKLGKYKWHDRGIRDIITELIDRDNQYLSMKTLVKQAQSSFT